MKRLAIFAVVAALGPWAVAQRGGGAGSHATKAHATDVTGARHISGGHGASYVRGGFGRSRFGGYGYGVPYDYLSLPFPFFDDAYDSGDMYSTGYPVAAPLPPYLPPPNAMRGYDDSVGPMMSSQAPPPSQPLMIELRNGRYVQMSSAAIDGEAAPLSTEANSSPAISSFEDRRSEANNLPYVVLIFKNGHQERVTNYSIANGILYAQGDYYTDGYWSKKIDLSALNLAESIQANDQRGVKFVLPSAPNEVVTRP
jgi:hypothetical protein